MCQKKKIPAQNKRGFWACGNYLYLDLSGSCLDIYFVKIHWTMHFWFVQWLCCISIKKKYGKFPAPELQILFIGKLPMPSLKPVYSGFR